MDERFLFLLKIMNESFNKLILKAYLQTKLSINIRLMNYIIIIMFYVSNKYLLLGIGSIHYLLSLS